MDTAIKKVGMKRTTIPAFLFFLFIFTPLWFFHLAMKLKMKPKVIFFLPDKVTHISIEYTFLLKMRKDRVSKYPTQSSFIFMVFGPAWLQCQPLFSLLLPSLHLPLHL